MGPWSLDFHLSIVNAAVTPNQTRYTTWLPRVCSTQKYPLFTSHLSPLKLALWWVRCPYGCPNGTLKDCAFSQKAHLGVFIPLISCFAPASPWVESNLERELRRIDSFGWITCRDDLNFTSRISFSDPPCLHTTRNNNCFWVVRRAIMWETF